MASYDSDRERAPETSADTGRKPVFIGSGAIASDPDLAQICALLYAATGIDFRGYKRGTIERRTRRRMARLRIDDLGAYARRLETDPIELRALAEDVLILTTGFFRDAEAFEA